MDKIIEKILKREGGYVVDHAGATNWGITKPSWAAYKGISEKGISDKDMASILYPQAFDFYHWLAERNGVDKIQNQSLQDLLLDSCVNHGSSRAVRWLQEAAGGIAVDGVLGDKTAAKVNKEPVRIHYKLLQKRIAFYAQIVFSNPDKYAKFHIGWTNRVNEFVEAI